jgi:hypothetical protein
MKKIVIGIPVMDMHEQTGISLSTTASYIAEKESVTFVIIDNASEKPYKKPPDTGDGLTIDVCTNTSNLGYYEPLRQLYSKYPEADYIGLMHNDAIVFQEGWDNKIREAFQEDKKLDAVGLFGWQKISRSGKNELPVGNIYWPFVVDDPEAPEPTFSQYHRRVHKITPVMALDSLFMVFRRERIPFLFHMDEKITISHGYDKIWSLRLVEIGSHVAILGIPFQHKGGNDKDIKMRKMFKEWFDERWEVNSPIKYVYDIAFFETQVLVVNEFRDRKKMIPCVIDDKYNIKKL